MSENNYKDWIITKERIKKSIINRHLEELKNHGNTLSTTEDWIHYIQREQERTLRYWITFLEQNQVDEKTKHWILDSIRKMANYSLRTYQFHRRNSHTIHPFAEINREAVLKIIKDNQDISFKKIYEQQLKKVLGQKSNIGIWKTYQGTKDASSLTSSLQGYYTRWCITNEENAYLHLLAGEVDVFYTETEQGYVFPRLAIGRNKLEVNRLVGLRDNQDLEDELISEVLKQLGIINLPVNASVERKLFKHR